MKGPGKLDLGAAAVAQRLQQVSRMASLHPARRLEGQVPMSPDAIAARLRLVDDLRTLGGHLLRAGAQHRRPP